MLENLASRVSTSSAESRVQRILSTVPQFCQRHPAFTLGGIRWLLFQRDTNGLQHAVVRLGQKILIDEARFFEWLDSQQKEANK